MSPSPRRNWDRNETLVAFNIYCRTPFGKLHARNPEIIRAAELLGRSPDALAMKCCNLAALDSSQQSRGIKGLRGTSRTDRQLWTEFGQDPEKVAYESETAFAALLGRRPREAKRVEWQDVVGLDRMAITKVRVNQYLFRSIVLAGYREQCAVCELPIARLLVASHIVPWSLDPSIRMNPCNGICLCSLHDRAFDAGLMTISTDFRIGLHRQVAVARSHVVTEQFMRFDRQPIHLPDRWHPDPRFLQRHQELSRVGQ
jgi:putative restriction endonuclease